MFTERAPGPIDQHRDQVDVHSALRQPGCGIKERAHFVSDTPARRFLDLIKRLPDALSHTPLAAHYRFARIHDETKRTMSQITMPTIGPADKTSKISPLTVKTLPISLQK